MRVIAIAALALLSPTAAAAAVVEYTQVMERLHAYDTFTLTGRAEVGTYNFTIRPRASGYRNDLTVAEFLPTGFMLPEGVEASIQVFSRRRTTGGRFTQPFNVTYANEELMPLAIGASVGFNPAARNSLIRIVIEKAPVGAGNFSWTGTLLPNFYGAYDGFPGTVLDADGVAVTPLPPAALMLLPLLVGLGAALRRHGHQRERAKTLISH